MTEYRVRDDGAKHRYYSEIPHMIDDAHLTPYAFRLYCHLKRVAGESGKCWQSAATLAEACDMSTGSVGKAKTELVKNKLIKIVKVKLKTGGRSAHNITIINVWASNELEYDKPTSSHDLATSPGDLATSPHDLKKNSIKNKQYEEVKPTPRKRDARIDHPALVTYKEIIRYHVPIIWRDRVIEAVTNDPDMVLSWTKLLDDWIGRGWKPTNIKGQLEAYNNGGISRQPTSTAAKNAAMLEEVFK